MRIENSGIDERYAKLLYENLGPTKERAMIADLTNEQVARVLFLATKIAKISQELPIAPQGFDVSIEIAKHLRASLELHNSELLELGALLR